MSRANYEFVQKGDNGSAVVLRDVGPWKSHPTVTNNAEAVVSELLAAGVLREGQQLLCYDSDGMLDELKHDGKRFTGFGVIR